MITRKQVYIKEDQLSHPFCTENKIGYSGLYQLTFNNEKLIRSELLTRSPSQKNKTMFESDLDFSEFKQKPQELVEVIKQEPEQKVLLEVKSSPEPTEAPVTHRRSKRK